MSNLNVYQEALPEKIPVQRVTVSAYRIPTDAPEADGTLSWSSTTMVLVQLEAGGKEGIGYTYAAVATAHFIEQELKDQLTGANALDIAGIHLHLMQFVRNNGTCGIAMMALSAVDNALWDLKAKILGLPLCLLLGKVRDEMLLYGSGGFTSYGTRRLQEQLGGWADQGIRSVKMKVGTYPQSDVQRVKEARKAIGKNTALFVDANGAYTVRQALDKADAFARSEVSWFEEPVSSDNLKGLQFIRQRAPEGMNIAAGEYGYNLPYFHAMLAAAAVDVLQGDATRCGGITGFLRAGHLCEAAQIPYSSHCAPALHLHAALCLPSFFIAEYFHDHVRIEQMLFDGVSPPLNGQLRPDLSRPGLGLEFKKQDAGPFQL